MLGRLTQLRLGQKLLILGIIALVMVAFPTLMYLQTTLGNVRTAYRQAEGIPSVVSVLAAVDSVQAHRGLSMGVLRGNKALESRRVAARDSVNSAFASAQNLLQTTAQGHKQVEDLAQAQQEWDKLEQSVAKKNLEAHVSFARHTALVAKLLSLNEELLHLYLLQINPHAQNQSLIQAVLLQASALGEDLGQLRGMGTGFLTQGYLLTEDRTEVRALMRRIDELQQVMQRQLERAMTGSAEYQATLNDPVQKANMHLAASIDAVHRNLLEVDIPQYPAGQFFDVLTQAIDAVGAVRTTGSQVLGERLQQDAQHQRNQLLAIVSAQGLCLALAVWMALVFVRSITQPLTQAVRLAQHVAHGDLTGDDAATQHNEIGELVDAQQYMRSHLRPIVLQVRTGAESVALASAEIAQGNQDLSTRTEDQATALEETAAAMEQLGAMVRQNAESAHEAHRLAQSAQHIAQQGGAVVSRVVQTMEGIHQGSRKMADIIGVIDTIAFQTNILALNAAVEAARAGTQGRGFAVVASEVRNLAQRSAEAAREIKQLIDDSITRVGDGHELTRQAGNTMTEVVTAIDQVNTIVSNISSASQEQADGMALVSESIEQLDQVTQQNAALVQEVATAASHLHQQGQELVRVVEVFQLGHQPIEMSALQGVQELSPYEMPHALPDARTHAKHTRQSKGANAKKVTVQATAASQYNLHWAGH